MKKILMFIFILTALSCFSLFGGCNALQDKNDENQVEHEFATEFSFDDNYHFRKCTKDMCKEVTDKAEHDLEVVKDGENSLLKCSVCGYSKEYNIEEHEHDFNDEWKNNEKYHWHACSFEGCMEREDKAEHAFGNPEITYTSDSATKKYTCVDCGYEKTETITIETIVSNENAWKDAFANLALINYSMRVDFTRTYNGETFVESNECHIAEDGAYVKWAGGSEYYLMKSEDGTFSNYRSIDKYENGERVLLGWVKIDDKTDHDYKDIVTQTVLPFTVEENYNNFEYNEETGSYLSTEEMTFPLYRIDQSGEQQLYATMIAFNAEVRVSDGKIAYISSEYRFPEGDGNSSIKYSFVFWNIGSSEVALPLEVSENAISETEYKKEYGGGSEEPIPEDPVPEEPISEDTVSDDKLKEIFNEDLRELALNDEPYDINPVTEGEDELAEIKNNLIETLGDESCANDIKRAILASRENGATIEWVQIFYFSSEISANTFYNALIKKMTDDVNVSSDGIKVTMMGVSAINQA